MNRIFSLLIICSISFGLFAQNKNFIKHTVVKGETISQIATKYKVTPFDIYQLNPDFQSGVKENDVVLIPTAPKIAKQVPDPHKNSSNIVHVATPKETLYSIARDYHVDVADLQNVNADILKNGLKVGQSIKIPNSIPVKNEPSIKEPVKSEEPKIVTKSDKSVFHIVEPKETKFGIAKKYGITIAQLEQMNPAIVSNLPMGYKLIISGNPSKTEIVKEDVQKPKPVIIDVARTETINTEIISTIKKSNGYANYEVKPKESLFSLAELFNITQQELIGLNPTLKDGVKIGMILKVPGKGSMIMVSSPNNKASDLTKTIKKSERKELVLLLPFNATKIQNDSLKTLASRLKKDAFLNMTLDFYSGALMAIDSAKTLGLNIDVKIYDSQESKLSSNVAEIINRNKFKNTGAVIGPFYQQYIEKAAEILNIDNVPVISPLSKEIGKSYSNLFQAMPPSDCMKSAIFDFMMSKGGNIIVVSDPKKVTNKEFISKKYPSAQFVGLTENGALDVNSLKGLLVKNKQNFVVLDSERTGMILGTTNAMLNEMANFQIQLAIIEPNETLDFEEISMKRLTILRMLYPSMTRDNNSPEATIFEKEYKAKNKIFPSQYATRGFDITFDTMLRLSQGKTFEVSANEDKTEQVESKFDYARKDSEGYLNKGIYIMEYQEDLTVKQVN